MCVTPFVCLNNTVSPWQKISMLFILEPFRFCFSSFGKILLKVYLFFDN